MYLPPYAAAPAASPSASTEGAAGPPSAALSAVNQSIPPLSPLAISPQPQATSTQLNPKKGAGMFYFSSDKEALKSARLSWTYNWWHVMDLVKPADTPCACCCDEELAPDCLVDLCLAIGGDCVSPDDQSTPCLTQESLRWCIAVLQGGLHCCL